MTGLEYMIAYNTKRFISNIWKYPALCFVVTFAVQFLTAVHNNLQAEINRCLLCGAAVAIIPLILIARKEVRKIEILKTALAQEKQNINSFLANGKTT